MFFEKAEGAVTHGSHNGTAPLQALREVTAKHLQAKKKATKVEEEVRLEKTQRK